MWPELPAAPIRRDEGWRQGGRDLAPYGDTLADDVLCFFAAILTFRQSRKSNHDAVVLVDERNLAPCGDCHTWKLPILGGYGLALLSFSA